MVRLVLHGTNRSDNGKGKERESPPVLATHQRCLLRCLWHEVPTYDRHVRGQYNNDGSNTNMEASSTRTNLRVSMGQDATQSSCSSPTTRHL